MRHSPRQWCSSPILCSTFPPGALRHLMSVASAGGKNQMLSTAHAKQMPDFTGTQSPETLASNGYSAALLGNQCDPTFVGDALSVTKQCALYEKKKMPLVRCQCTARLPSSQGEWCSERWTDAVLPLFCALAVSLGVLHCDKTFAQFPSPKEKKRRCYVSRRSTKVGTQHHRCWLMGRWTSPAPVTQLKEIGAHLGHSI